MPQVSSTDRHSAIIVTFAPSSVRWHLNPTFITSTNQLLPNVKSHWNVLICAGIEFGFRNTDTQSKEIVARPCTKDLTKAPKTFAWLELATICVEHKTKSPSWTDWKLALYLYIQLYLKKTAFGGGACIVFGKQLRRHETLHQSHPWKSLFCFFHMTKSLENANTQYKIRRRKNQFNQQRWEWLY